MPITYEGFEEEHLQQNMAALADNPYPGRGIVQGLSEDGESYIQAYWVMGRSDNSRNRVLVNDEETVSTEAHDPSKVEDPSLIIYPAMMVTQDRHNNVVSNGVQTDAVINCFNNSSPTTNIPQMFSSSLMLWDFEPDKPNYTPRITGYITFLGLMGYSIIKRDPLTDTPVHTVGKTYLDELPAGVGLCLHTYEGDGDPLPSFKGTPYPLPVLSTAETTAEKIWDNLDQRNRVAIAVKSIGRKSGEISLSIINALDEPARV